MPRVKIERDKCTSEEVTTRSKAKIECKNKSPPLVILKRCKSRPMSQPKTMTPKRQPNKGIDEDRSNENLRQNKDGLKSAKSQIKKASGDNSKKVEQKPNKNKFIILDDVSKGSEDHDSKYESEDDYEPDTEDEEEYRSRSYFW